LSSTCIEARKFLSSAENGSSAAAPWDDDERTRERYTLLLGAESWRGCDRPALRA